MRERMTKKYTHIVKTENDGKTQNTKVYVKTLNRENHGQQRITISTVYKGERITKLFYYLYSVYQPYEALGI